MVHHICHRGIYHGHCLRRIVIGTKQHASGSLLSDVTYPAD